MKELTLLVSTSTVQSLTLWGDIFMTELTLLVSTSTVPPYWRVTFIKELTLLVSTSTVQSLN